MQENLQTNNSNVYVTTARATTTTTTITGKEITNILKPQGIQNSVCIDSGKKVIYRFPNTPTTITTTTTPRESMPKAATTSWEKKEPINGAKKKHVTNISNNCMRMKVKLPSFWPAFLANIGICALLIGYIFIGSFLFMSIENDSNYNMNEDEKQFFWNPASQLQQFEQQQQQQQQQQENDILNNVHYAHISNHTMNEVVLLKAATATTTKTTTTTTTNIHQIAHTQRMLNIRDNIKGNNDHDLNDVNDAATVEHDDVEAEERQRTVENIWDITVSLNILYKENWTRLAALELARFQNHLMKRLTLDLINNPHHHNYHHTKSPSASIKAVKEYYKQHSILNSKVEWRFSTAFLYSLTLISTVGYGTLTPHTALGRAVTIAYGTLGIPLMLIYLSSVGSILSKLMRFWFTGIFCCCSCCCGVGNHLKGNSIKHKREIKKNEIHRKQPPSTTSQSHNMSSYFYVHPPVEMSSETAATATANATNAQFVLGTSSYDTLSIGTHDSHHRNTFGCSIILPIIFSLLLWLFYISMGSIVISLLEQWPLIDGIYFCFMSLTTIGFCDLLPGLRAKNSDVLYTSNIAVWFCAFYILIGLTLISMCVNMLHEEIMSRMHAKLPNTKNIKKQQQTAFYAGGLP